MTDKLTGEINLTHKISPDLEATIKHTTDDYLRGTINYKINKNTDVELSRDSEENSNITLNVKI